MSAENVKLFESILEKEQDVLESIVENQKLLRKAVLEKDWDNLVKIINEINYLSENFQQIDEKRDSYQQELSAEELLGFTRKLSALRTKLSASKIENKALCDYVSITRGFIDGVIDAVPQGRNKTYSNTGKIIQNQPTSVVLNISF